MGRTHRSCRMAGVVLGLFVSAVAIAVVPSRLLADSPPAAERLDTFEGHGQMCLVCGMPVRGGEVVVARYKGRTFHVAAAMFDRFKADPQRYFRQLEARGALFDEMSMESSRVSMTWLWVGVYVLAGLVFGGTCAYVAIGKCLPAWPWFFAGLVGSVVGLGAVLAWPGSVHGDSPEGVPGGLRKVPRTRRPLPCARCGASNHPAAARCGGCGGELQPTVEAEVARV